MPFEATLSDEERESRWAAESDARTITEAAIVTADTPRLEAAQVAAKRMADEKAVELEALKKLGDKSKWPLDYKKTLNA
jgi:hypothetical protein